tara:strand:- start:223 stop:660 length:438 start_codon:yes stop_codon:yes gene_type:complete
MLDCCDVKATNKCYRKSDKKVFRLPRKFSRVTCVLKSKKGFTMRSSCAPYKDCKKTFDVYINQNPKDTIPIKYTTEEDVKHTIKKLERLFKQKKYSHQRLWQVGMILMVRLRALKKTKPKQYKLAKEYFEFLGKRTKNKTLTFKK